MLRISYRKKIFLEQQWSLPWNAHFSSIMQLEVEKFVFQVTQSLTSDWKFDYFLLALILIAFDCYNINFSSFISLNVPAGVSVYAIGFQTKYCFYSSGIFIGLRNYSWSAIKIDFHCVIQIYVSNVHSAFKLNVWNIE